MIQHINPECKACTGEGNCTKYCPMRVGQNIEKFFDGLDSLDTKIGDVRSDTVNPKQTLIVCGHILERSGLPASLLKPSSMVHGIITNNKLSDFIGMTATQHINTYCSFKDIDHDKKVELVDKLKKFNSNKCVPCPVSPGVEISVMHMDFYGKKVESDTYVEQVRWEVSELGELEAFIFAPVNNNSDGKRCVKVKLQDYLKTWKLPNLERNLTNNEICPEIISMTPVGFIRPIAFKDSKNVIAVDSINLYLNRNGRDHIIGYWDKANRSMAVYDNIAEELKNSKAYKKMAKTINYIWRHHRFMIPYGLTEPNEIEC